MTWVRGERRVFTVEDDALIQKLRDAGRQWGQIAEALGRPKTDGSCIRQRAAVAGLRCYQPKRRGQPPEPLAMPPSPPPSDRHVPTLAELVPLRSLK